MKGMPQVKMEGCFSFYYVRTVRRDDLVKFLSVPIVSDQFLKLPAGMNAFILASHVSSTNAHNIAFRFLSLLLAFVPGGW